MGTFGGFSPYPRRFGGGKRRLQTIHEGLTAQRGTAYSKDRASVVWVENMAIARAIDASWSTNQRLANQADPRRMTDMLPRWEKIFGIPARANVTDADRRAEVAARMARIGHAAIHALILTECQRVLGPFFVAVEYIDVTNAVVHSPDGTYPWGTQVDGYPWYSTVAHVLVRAVKPAGFTDADYWAKKAELAPVIDAILPVWATWTMYRCPAVGTPYNVVGGPSCAGWYLDEPNLDLLVFRI